MLTTDDIKKLTDYLLLVFREVFATKEDIERLEGTMNTMQITLDTVVKDNETTRQELLSINYRTKNAEDWIDKASPIVGVKFEH